MSEEMKAAFVVAQCEMMRVELEGMLAENQHRMNTSGSIAYGEEAFEALRTRYEPVLGYNALMTLAQQ
jgi:hypothetical protein